MLLNISFCTTCTSHPVICRDKGTMVVVGDAFVHPSVRPSVRPSIPSIYPSIHTPVHPSHPFTHPSIRLSTHPSHPFTHPSICLSIHLSILFFPRVTCNLVPVLLQCIWLLMWKVCSLFSLDSWTGLFSATRRREPEVRQFSVTSFLFFANLPCFVMHQ